MAKVINKVILKDEALTNFLDVLDYFEKVSPEACKAGMLKEYIFSNGFYETTNKEK